MAYAQLTRREGLRDLIACLNSQSTKLYHAGLRQRVSRSTLHSKLGNLPPNAFEQQSAIKQPIAVSEKT